MNKVEVWIEPVFSSSQWCHNLLNGIKHGAKTHHLHVLYIETATPHYVDDGAVVLTGETQGWFHRMLDYCNNNRIRCCVASNIRIENEFASLVQCDYRQISRNMSRYLFSAGKRKIALLGINHSSPSDMIRVDGYLDAIRMLSLDLSEKDIFFTEGNIAKCCDDFLMKHDDYDAVIASNNLYAVYLLGRLKRAGIKVPEDLFLSSFGITKLAQASIPSITTIADNLHSIGYQSMVCIDSLVHDSNISRLSIVVQPESILGGSTEYYPFPEFQMARSDYAELSVYSTNDDSINKINRLESCLFNADKIDCQIIFELARNKLTKSEIAEKLFISEGTLNYRTDKMIKKNALKSRAEFIALLQEYSEFIDFSKLIE